MHGTLVFLTVCGLTLNWLCDWLTGNGTNTKSRYIAHTYIYILCHTEGSQRFFSLSLSHTHTHTHLHTTHITHSPTYTMSMECEWVGAVSGISSVGPFCRTRNVPFGRPDRISREPSLLKRSENNITPPHPWYSVASNLSAETTCPYCIVHRLTICLGSSMCSGQNGVGWDQHPAAYG